jgi:hypothetical protein
MRTLFIIAAALLAVALPAVALASRTPSRSERVQLREAVKDSKPVGKKLHKGKFKLSKPRISTKGPWAKAGIVPNGTYTDPFDPTLGIFKRKHGHWKLKVIGSSGVGCSKPRLPRSVRKDLKLSCS